MQKQHNNSLAVVIKSLALIVVFAFAFISCPCAQVFDFEEEDKLLDDVSDQLTDNLTSNMPEQRPLRQDIVTNTANQKNKVTVSKVETVNSIDPNEKIYMYMRDFKVSKNINGRISCDVRFYLSSKVKEKITNISYRLKWPNMETALSHSNVEPEGEVSVNYTLLGEGCYDMDGVPNIIVNRCRIKGRSQEYCASIIKWAK